MGSEMCIRDRTRPRLLADLHRRWQRDLESLRRERFLQIQQRTQWVVAGSVMASPIASLDLLAVAVANGLMIKDMGEIWGTSLQPDVLREAAAQLARVALPRAWWSGPDRPCWGWPSWMGGAG